MTAGKLSVLITGASGNLGRMVRRHFAANESYDLRLLCLNPSNDPAVTTVDLSLADNDWERHLDGVDVVLHLAADSRVAADWASVRRNNIELTRNVFNAAVRHRVGRVVFASSGWTMAGYRFGNERLTAELPPLPVGAYGLSKMIGEQIAREFARQHELSIVCLRIGFRPPSDAKREFADYGRWEQEMWISDRDLCQLFERAMLTPDVRFAIVNGESRNPGMRWDLEETRRVLGYVPEDSRTVVMTPGAKAREVRAQLA